MRELAHRAVVLLVASSQFLPGFVAASLDLLKSFLHAATDRVHIGIVRRAFSHHPIKSLLGGPILILIEACSGCCMTFTRNKLMVILLQNIITQNN